MYAPFITSLLLVFSSIFTLFLPNIIADGFLNSRIALYDPIVSFASAGRYVSKLGNALKLASYSIGWCVGPSSPTVIESWLNTYIIGRSIKALNLKDPFK